MTLAISSLVISLVMGWSIIKVVVSIAGVLIIVSRLELNHWFTLLKFALNWACTDEAFMVEAVRIFLHTEPTRSAWSRGPQYCLFVIGHPHLKRFG